MTITLRPSGHMHRTPIGERVVLLDLLTFATLPIAMVDPHTLEPNPEHPADCSRRALPRGARRGRSAERLSIPLTVLTDGFLIDGHRRRAIALEVGLVAVPVCYLNGAQ